MQAKKEKKTRRKKKLCHLIYLSKLFQTPSCQVCQRKTEQAVNVHASLFVSALYLPDRLHATACMAVSSTNSFPALSLPEPLYLAITEQFNTDSSSHE